MKNKEKFFILDGHSLAYRAFYAIKYLSTSAGEPTNVIFGFIKMLLKILKEQKPDYLAICFDSSTPSFRTKRYAEYKSNRPKMPDEMKIQLAKLKEVISGFNITIFEIESFEADDIIATLAKNVNEHNIQTIIVTQDKDFSQIVSSDTLIMSTQKGITDFVIIDVDVVKQKFGVLPSQFTDLIGLMGDKSDNIPGVPGIGPQKAQKLLNQFNNLENIFANISYLKDEKLKLTLLQYENQAKLSKELAKIVQDVPLDFTLEKCKVTNPNEEILNQLFKQLEFNSLLKEETKTTDYKIIKNTQDLDNFISYLKTSSFFAFKILYTKSIIEPQIIGISISTKPDINYFISDDFTKLKPIFEDEKIKKYGYNLKEDMIILKFFGINLKGLEFDIMLAAYLLNPAKTSYSIEDISLYYLNYQIHKTDEYIGVDLIIQLKNLLYEKLKEENLLLLFYQIETPLIEVLANMEFYGVKIDLNFLNEFSKELEIKLLNLEKEIYALIGEKFNISSPKQLSNILFEKLQLKPIKKTKTLYSTDNEVLKKLAIFHPLPGIILSYREIMKLKNTYVDVLPKLYSLKNNRIHTTFNQTGTVTGRLSSSSPNLQNIPMKGEIGREIRKAFIPEKNYVLLCADYSQIELRILASLSEDENLIQSFLNDEDIHFQTARLIFKTENIDYKLRKFAKTINFGIIYGMSAYGLSKELEISYNEAEDLIAGYFAKYPKVRDYIDKIITQAREKKYVTTLFGRKRYLPEILSFTKQIREFAERNAINSPVQGTCADIIKLAMIDINEKIKNIDAHLILQVHDELILEVLESEVEKVKEIVKFSMENIIKLKVPLKVEITTGKNWYEAG